MTEFFEVFWVNVLNFNPFYLDNRQNQFHDKMFSNLRASLCCVVSVSSLCLAFAIFVGKLVASYKFGSTHSFVVAYDATLETPFHLFTTQAGKTCTYTA